MVFVYCSYTCRPLVSLSFRMPLKPRESSEIWLWYEWLFVTSPLVHRFWYRSTRKLLVNRSVRIAAPRRPRDVRQRIPQRHNDRFLRVSQKRKFQVAAIFNLSLKFPKIVRYCFDRLPAPIRKRYRDSLANRVRLRCVHQLSSYRQPRLPGLRLDVHVNLKRVR